MATHSLYPCYCGRLHRYRHCGSCKRESYADAAEFAAVAHVPIETVEVTTFDEMLLEEHRHERCRFDHEPKGQPMTFEAKHTPGPWEARRARTLIHITGQSGVCEISVSANHIHEDYPGCKRAFIQRQEANARLIATAPELYEIAALFEKSIAYEIDRSRGDGDDEGARMKLITLNMVRDVLVKAAGAQK